ncbi:MAG: holo-ACP synthase [Acidobacteriota bacterium]|jgi:holo-[acyl-carrier protein] synthase
MIAGTGVDIVEIERIRGMTERLKDRFANRVFTAEEQWFCYRYRDSAPHFAARFAAKEALFKALGTGWAKGVSWLDCEVLRKDSEAPVMMLHGQALKRSELLGVQRIHLSISHTDQYAVATVVLETA